MAPDSPHVPDWQAVAMALVFVVVATAPSAGGSQSPIDLISSKAVKTQLAPLRFQNYSGSHPGLALENTGHGFKVISKGERAQRPYVQGGPLRGRYIFEQLHVHWGSNDSRGSEHWLDGKPFAMEAHLLHWNSKYASYDEAASKPDGFAVIAIFLEARAKARAQGRARRPSAGFQRLVEAIPAVRAAAAVRSRSSRAVVAGADLINWVAASLREAGYFSYNGSLTSPPYSENVAWIVYKNPIVIAKSQIAPFRSIEDNHGHLLRSNNRAPFSSSNVAVLWVPSALRPSPQANERPAPPAMSTPRTNERQGPPAMSTPRTNERPAPPVMSTPPSIPPSPPPSTPRTNQSPSSPKSSEPRSTAGLSSRTPSGPN